MKFTNLFSAKIKPQNPFESAQETRSKFDDYEQAELQNAPKTFRESNKIPYSLSKFWQSFYPILSVSAATSGVYFYISPFMTGQSLGTKVTMILLGVLLFMLIVGIEFLKSHFGKDVRGSIFKRCILSLLTIISIVSSCLGVYITTKDLSSKDAEFSKQSIIASDSIARARSIEISALESQIKSLQSDLSKTRNKWLKISLNEQLSKASEQLSKVRGEVDNKINIQTEAINEAKTQYNDDSTLWAKIALLVFLVCELLLIASFWFMSYWNEGLIIENRAFEIVPIPSGDIKPENTYTLLEHHQNDIYKNLQNDITELRLLVAQYKMPLPSETKTSTEPEVKTPSIKSSPNPIGFQFSVNTENQSNTESVYTEPVYTENPEALKFQGKNCKHCGKPIINAKSVRREYCDNDDHCKDSYHAAKNGVSLDIYRQGVRKRTINGKR